MAMRIWWAFLLGAVLCSLTACGPAVEMDRSGPVPTVVDENARFQVLSPQVIRLEYAPNGRFEDRATFFVRHRTARSVDAETRIEDGWRIVETSKTQVRYRRGSGSFDSSNVEVRVAAEGDTIHGKPTWPTRPTCRPGQVCQAEDGWQNGEVQRNSSYAWYTGPGYVEHLASGSVAWTVGETASDSLTIGVRYATPTADTIQVSGPNLDQALRLSATEGWDDWSTVRDTVPAQQGRFRVQCDDCTVHLDYLTMVKVGQSLPRPNPGRMSPLSGWRHGLGNRSEAIPFYPGIVRRQGWALHDDSRTAVVRRDTSWVAPRNRSAAYRDGYVFGYGNNYGQALRNKAHLAGTPPLLPRWAFGVWYSRLHPHTAADYRKTIVPKARERNLPLSALVLDTDVKAPNRWRGWTWENKLLPHPDSFFAWTDRQDLRVALNIHPSIGEGDPRYPTAQRVADSSLVDIRGKCPRWQGDTGACVGWDWGRPSHTASYMAVHDSLQRQGIDVWWLDWCCDASRVSMPGLTPDTWINEQYARARRERDRRGFVLSRIGSSWQGPEAARPGAWATHRSTIHFTGDTNPTWEMLDFEVEFTTREGMMGIPYVSHDIGSFHGGGPRAETISDEMYVRWVQFGVMQPVFRFHGHGTRLPWQFGAQADSITSEFLRLRGGLVPYLYTAAREAHDTGLPMVRGLPLRYPDYDAAYRFEGEYLLGDQLLVAPVTKPRAPVTKSVWIPPGTWVDWFTGRRYEGPQTISLTVPLARMPVFVRAGGIVPLQASQVGDQASEGPLRIRVVAGADGRSTVYTDAGTGTAYRDGNYTERTMAWTDSTRTLRIEGTKRDAFRGQRDRRRYELRIDGVAQPQRVVLKRVEDGKKKVVDRWSHDDEKTLLRVETPSLAVDRDYIVQLEY